MNLQQADLHNHHILVLLATFNGEQFIREQLKTIQSQISANVSIVASDDSSYDLTAAILQKEFASIKFLSRARQGRAAQNFFRLLRDADFTAVDYVALSDQDDIWQLDKLSYAVKKIQENNIDAYSSNVTAFWSNGKQQLINKAQPQQQWDYMFESGGPGCTFVLSRKLALEIQAFLIANQAQCKHIARHDWLIYAFARSRGFKWMIDHESHMLYRQHAQNVAGANSGIRAQILRFKKLRQGWLFDQALLIADVLGYADMEPIKKIKRLSLRNRVWLVLNVRKLRRRLRDCVALAFLMMVFIKK